jgi:hypothetical protein
LRARNRLKIPFVRRVVWNIATLMLLGAAINLAVAWLCVLLHGYVVHEWSPHHNPRDEHPLVVILTDRFGHSIVSGCGRSGTLLARHGERVKSLPGQPWWPSEAVDPTSPPWPSYGVASGWPALAFSAWRTTNVIEASDQSRLYYDPVYHWGFAWGPRFPYRPAAGEVDEIPLVFPLRPIWSGFALNTMFYALAAFLFIRGACTMRRRSRRRHGLCVRCAYPLTGNVTGRCPECGRTHIDDRRRRSF